MIRITKKLVKGTNFKENFEKVYPHPLLSQKNIKMFEDNTLCSQNCSEFLDGCKNVAAKLKKLHSFNENIQNKREFILVVHFDGVLGIDFKQNYDIKENYSELEFNNIYKINKNNKILINYLSQQFYIVLIISESKSSKEKLKYLKKMNYKIDLIY